MLVALIILNALNFMFLQLLLKLLDLLLLLLVLLLLLPYDLLMNVLLLFKLRYTLKRLLELVVVVPPSFEGEIVCLSCSSACRMPSMRLAAMRKGG
jgi:hypothetical protein